MFIFGASTAVPLLYFTQPYAWNGVGGSVAVANAWIWCAFSEHYPRTEAEIRGESRGETEHK